MFFKKNKISIFSILLIHTRRSESKSLLGAFHRSLEPWDQRNSDTPIKKYSNFFNSFLRFKLHHHIDYLLKKKLLIDVVYDIGAYEGEWSLFMRNTCLKNSSFYLFEANNKHERMIKSRGFKYHMGVLSDEIKNVNFYSKNHQGDSYYLEQTNYYEKDLEPLNLKTNTLDQIILENYHIS